MDPVSPRCTKIGRGMYLDTRNKPVTAILKFPKFDLARRGQRSNFRQNHRFSDSTLHKMDPVSRIMTKLHTNMRPYTRTKLICRYYWFSKSKMAAGTQNGRRWVQICVFSYSTLHKMDPVSLRCTKIGTGMYLYTTNKPVTAILKFRKIDLARRGQRSNLTRKFDPEITFWLLTRNL